MLTWWEQNPSRKCNSASPPAPRPRPPASGWWDAAGTTLCGPSRRRPHARTSTRPRAIIPPSSPASTATSPSPTPPRCKPRASPPRLPIPMAAKSTATTKATPPASCARPPRARCTRKFRRPTRPNAAERAQAGFQLGFHAIGDRGARMALEAFAFARQRDPRATRDFRYRIEHAQVVAPEDYKKFHDLGVIASMQPNHLLTDMNWAEAHIGAARAEHSYAWKEFLDDGVVLAFGTDYPVEPITPFRGLYAAVTRKNEAGTKEYFPGQKLNIHQAIAAYTPGSAYAEFAEKEKGTLAPGMLADFVVLDRDITKVAPPEILKTRVLRTVVGGKTVYEAK